MWMPAPVRRRILRYLFENGVLVVSDNAAGIHDELECLNIYVFQLGRAFTNKGYTKKRYAWSHAYYTLTDDGVAYLAKLFGAPEALPATLKPRQAQGDILERREGGRGGFRGAGRGGGFRGGRGRRDDDHGEPRGDRPERRDGDRPERGDGAPRPSRRGGYRGGGAAAPEAEAPQ
jgi:small subunit ribosomal protein S10e